MKIIPKDIKEEEFKSYYQRFVNEFNKLGVKPSWFLKEMIIDAEKIISVRSNQRTDKQNKDIDQARECLCAEVIRYNGLEKKYKNIPQVNQELSDLERRIMPKNISDRDKTEISSYFQLMRSQPLEERDSDYNEFIDAISSIDSGDLLAFLKITQAHLKGLRSTRHVERDYEDEVQEETVKLLKFLPLEYKERVIDVLVNSTENGRSAVGLCILLKSIPKQLGLAEYRDTSWCVDELPNGKRYSDFYLETARRLAERDHYGDDDILTNIPIYIKQRGLKEAKRIVEIAFKIREEDFPDEQSVIVSYLMAKAGHPAHREEKDKLLVKQVEERYK